MFDGFRARLLAYLRGLGGPVHFDGWAVLELMGHRRVAGRVREVREFGARMLQVDIPSDPPATQLYSVRAVYCLTPVSEEAARAQADRPWCCDVVSFRPDDEDDGIPF